MSYRLHRVPGTTETGTRATETDLVFRPLVRTTPLPESRSETSRTGKDGKQTGNDHHSSESSGCLVTTHQQVHELPRLIYTFELETLDFYDHR